MNPPAINLEDAPAWDFFVEIRGARLPLVSPHDTIDMPACPIPSQEKIDSLNDRWPGILVWAWRFIAGAPRVNRDDIPDDGGARYTRSVCKTILGQEHAELVDSLGSGECSQLVAMYMGLQEKWLIAANQYAMDTADKSLAPEDEPADGMTKLVPGQAVPAVLHAQMNPLVMDDRGGQA